MSAEDCVAPKESAQQQIKTSRICFQPQGKNLQYLTEEEKNKIQAHISTLDGVVTANISLKKKPNILTIHFRPN
jgi:hypothetical protein